MTSKRKLPEIEGESSNAKIARILVELSNYEKNKNRNMFKFKAYRKAADLIKTHPTDITSGSEAKKLAGIGDKIAKKIDEILSTGKLRKLCEVREDDEANALNELTRVTGIGPALAKKLVADGIKSIEQLRQHTDRLNHHQKIGLKHFSDFELRIPRSEMKSMEQLVLSELKAVDSDAVGMVCGSYRRGAQSSGDIDFLLTHPAFKSDGKSDKQDNKRGRRVRDCLLAGLVTRLQNAGFVTDTLSHGSLKYMGVCKLEEAQHYRRIDLQLIPYDQFYCGLIHFTGSDLFNQRIRGLAHKLGFVLNEYCLRPVGSTGVPGEPMPVGSEEDVFEYLGLEFKEPADRSH